MAGSLSGTQSGTATSGGIAVMGRGISEDDRLRRAGLRHVTPDGFGIRRRRCGKGFTYVDARGRRVADADALARIRSLAIPPNYQDVRIAEDPRAHIQAVGQDSAGRTQYRYHPDWDEVRELAKLDRLSVLSEWLPRIRRRIARDLAAPEPSRSKTLAAVVAVVDRTHIRIGCEDYVHSGRSRGAATLLKRNVRVDGDQVTLSFRGKGGQEVRCGFRALALAEAIAQLRRLPGRRLFQYRDAAGRIHPATAPDANAYLQEITGQAITTKDFRTLAATAEAAVRLAAMEPDPRMTVRRRQIAGVMREVADLLGNTPAVARKSYVHRRVVEAFEAGRLAPLLARARSGKRVTRGEALVHAMFAARQEDRTGS